MNHSSVRVCVCISVGLCIRVCVCVDLHNTCLYVILHVVIKDLIAGGWGGEGKNKKKKEASPIMG